MRQLTGEQPDVDSYDACYLPDGRILFTSTACFIGVPCVYGSSHVANLYRMDADGRNIRQLCFDQEHDWCPTVLNNGRVLYPRWEYTDTPHSNTRLLFHMNPDGTGQMEYLGSNSYWPNSFFYARPIPGHPTQVIAVIGGHHDNPRMGELVIFDPAQGRREAEPAVQRIPGYGQQGRAGHQRRADPGELAEVPAPLSRWTEVLPRLLQADAGVALGHLPGRRVRQLGAAAASCPATPCSSRSPCAQRPAPPVIPDKVDPRQQGRAWCSSRTSTPATA